MKQNPFKTPVHASNVKRFGVLAGSVLTMMQHAEREGHAHTAKELVESLPMFSPALIKKALTMLKAKGVVYVWKKHLRPKVKNPSPGEFLHGPHASAEQRIAAKDALEAAAKFYDNEELTTKPKKLRGYKAPKSFVDIGLAVAIEYDSDKFDGKPRIYRHESEVKRRMLLSTDGSTAIFVPPFGLTKKGIEG